MLNFLKKVMFQAVQWN